MEDGRLKAVRQALMMNQGDFAKTIGLQQGSYSSIEKGKGKSTITAQTELLLRFVHGVNIDYLYGKSDTMFLTSQEKMQEEKPVMNYDKGVPYYNVYFECGFNSVENDQTTTPHCLIDLEAYSKADCWCNAKGDSMIPEINPGDIIALKELHDWQTYIPYGEIYAIVTTEHRTIKRICKSDVEGCVLLLPTNLNGKYSPQDIPLRIVQRIYKVIGCIKRFEQ